MPTVTRTYANPQDWANHPLCDQLEDGVHICASSNMRKGISIAYPNYTNLCSINELMKNLYPTWNSSEFQFGQFLELSSWLKNNHGRFPNSELYEAFRSNRKGIVMLMRKLAESGVQPKDLEKTFQDMQLRGQYISPKEEMFLKIWEALDRNGQNLNNNYSYYRHVITSGDLTLEDLQNAIKKIKHQDSKPKALSTETVIFLHGFYFITPEQQFFLELLSKKFNVVMFLYYEPQYERTFSFMRSFIQPAYGWEPIPLKNMSSDYKANHISDLFLRVYENDSSHFQTGTQKVLAYENFFEYMQDVIYPNYSADKMQKENKSFEIFTPNATQMNELLVNHYPELDQQNRNFLSYPVGRFFSTIHEIYKDGEYELSYNQLHELFASGWLYNPETNENARDFTYDLKGIQAYTERATTIDMWIELCERLKRQLSFIDSQFPLPRDASRMQKSTRSPFAKNSHFSMDADRINNIILFLYDIKTICNELFEDGQTGTKINLHFKRLDRVMNKRMDHLQGNFDNVEKQLLKDLSLRLSMIKSDTDFFYNDLHEAVSLYLSGKFDSKQDKLIRPFTEIDGEAFKHRVVSEDYKVYVGGLDEHALPITPEVYHWPLQKDTWLALSDHVPRIGYDYMRKDAKKYISRYLFYIMLRFIPSACLNLSWIRHFIDQEERKSALYVRQLELPVENYSQSIEQYMSAQSHDLTGLYYSQEEIEKGYSTLLYNDFFAEYVQCPKRFYYSYLMQEYPVFQQEFTQGFLYTELVKISAKNSRIDSASLFTELDPFFPQWIKVKKSFEFENALKYAYKKKQSKQEIEDNVYVSEIRKNFQFPGLKNKNRNKLYESALSNRQEIEKGLIDENLISFEAISGYHCRFCPHIDVCPSVTYGIDLKEDIDE